MFTLKQSLFFPLLSENVKLQLKQVCRVCPCGSIVAPVYCLKDINKRLNYACNANVEYIGIFLWDFF